MTAFYFRSFAYKVTCETKAAPMPNDTEATVSQRVPRGGFEPPLEDSKASATATSSVRKVSAIPTPDTSVRRRLPTNEHTKEVWRPVAEPGYENLYAVSDLGRVMRTGRNKGAVTGRVLSLNRTSNGYDRVEMGCPDFRRRTFAVHRLVLGAFVGPPPSDSTVCNHIDGNKANNRLGNLEWVTPAENVAHARDHGLYPLGVEVHNAKVDAGDVREIRRRCWGGESQQSVSDDYPISRQQVGRISRMEDWSHLPQQEAA